MPWRVESVMEQRLSFVLEAKRSGESLSSLCLRYGVSRRVGYKWLKRYQQAGVAGMQELSRRPHHSPSRTSPDKEQKVLQVRDEKGWGAEKIQYVLEQAGLSLPVITIHRILKRHQRVGQEQASRLASKRFARENCNELAQMDFKGDYTLPGGGKCYPLSLLDDCSRYLLGLWPLSSTGSEGVQQVLRAHFRQCGVPQEILTDHGCPWYANTSRHGLTRFSVWLIKQGITIKYSAVGHPQTQGKVERFHQTLKRRTKHRGEPASMREWQSWAHEFRQEYNHQRPHQSLGMKTPAAVYNQENLRPYQERPSEWEYSGGQVRRLNTQGMLRFRGQLFFVCEALSQEWVRIDEVEHRLTVTFRHLTIREIDLRAGNSIPVLLPGPNQRT